jgi:hypothetical protein
VNVYLNFIEGRGFMYKISLSCKQGQELEKKSSLNGELFCGKCYPIAHRVLELAHFVFLFSRVSHIFIEGKI